MKKCSACKETKPLPEFTISSAKPDGRGSLCKPCAVKATQARQRTLRGLIKKIFHNQKMTTSKMGRPAPAYTEQELFDWVMGQGYEPMWQAWVDSGYDKWKSPSVDRQNNALSYTLSNIELMPWRQNLDNYIRDNHKGVMPRSDTKPVDQLTKDGEFIHSYLSAAIACRAMTGKNKSISNITMVCAGKLKTAYGYKWRFALCWVDSEPCAFPALGELGTSPKPM